MAFVALVAAVYFYFDPEGSVIFPKCPFLSLTGYQCPGCGSQRAIHALLHGDIGAAWGYNAALVMFLPVIALLIMAEALKGRYPRFHRTINSLPVMVGSFVALTAWWILRNVF